MFGREKESIQTNQLADKSLQQELQYCYLSPNAHVKCELFQFEAIAMHETDLFWPEIGLPSRAERRQLMTLTVTVRRRQRLRQTEGVAAAPPHPSTAGSRHADGHRAAAEPPRCERPANNNGRAVLHITARIVRRIRLVGRGRGLQGGVYGRGIGGVSQD